MSDIEQILELMREQQKTIDMINKTILNIIKTAGEHESLIEELQDRVIGLLRMVRRKDSS